MQIFNEGNKKLYNTISTDNTTIVIRYEKCDQILKETILTSLEIKQF